MRLKYIRLVGFKSFVEATKVNFPEQMTCVVGPNGCGKSNVIDAVRWVLGESSAKNLRGDAMADVIFNGSTSRAAISQASVELVFDNQTGRIGGEYAQYQEISVKRQVHRDGQSLYFLNGSKCRRRDISDLFLGTGLGPRSYAIIEQGMISRLIESRPQELRVFIEEAAGISKYKERRKETESRMNRTRDNLERLSDVREELGKQLQKLQRQAAAAQRYQTLKAEERRLKSELQAFRWLQYQEQCDRLELQLTKEETELEKWIAEQRGSELGQTTLREKEQEAQAKTDRAQADFYESSNQVSRCEQQLNHLRQVAQQRKQQIEQLQQKKTLIEEELISESGQLDYLEEEQILLTERVEETQLLIEEAQEARLAAELARQAWETSWQNLRDVRGKAEQQLSIKEAEQQAQQTLSDQLQQQITRYQEELSRLQNMPEETLHHLKAELKQGQQALAEQLPKKTENQNKLVELKQQKEQQELRVKQLQSQVYQLAGELKSLEVLIQANQKDKQPSCMSTQTWLEEQDYLGRLHEFIQVPELYQQALESLIRPWLGAPLLKKHPEFWPDFLQEPCLVLPAKDLQRLDSKDSPIALQTYLPEKIKGLFLWHRVGVAETEEKAQQLLQNGEWDKVLLPEGRVLGLGWLLAEGEDAPSLLHWQKQQEKLADSLERCQAELQKAEAQQDYMTQQALAVQQKLEEQEQGIRSLEQNLIRAQERLVSEEQQIQIRTEKTVQLQEDLQQAELKNSESHKKIEALMEEQISLQLSLEQSAPDLEELQQRGNELQAKDREAQQILQNIQQEQHQVQLEAQKITSQIQYVTQTKKRLKEQLEAQQEELKLLLQQQQSQDSEEYSLVEEQLAEALLNLETTEQALSHARNQLATVQAELAVVREGQGSVLAQIEKQRAQVEANRLELATARERGNALLDSFQEMRVSLKEVLEKLPESVSEQEWQSRLQDCQRKLSQLGAINLAALEEVKVQQERQSHLDNQYEDLLASLETLEAAIRKIDRETRTKFKETFDQVNEDLQLLFPKIFSGGSAYLELTDSDLLETGVTIMARPPGKKNSTIHLLSGGEKALTALALVFAIFRLNPAPFCLLDEVDAPLDDINVGRFCRLVQEMSESVQFIYISHNKIAMEMATHLIGVTMQEAGVSRLVAVDIDEALALSEVS